MRGNEGASVSPIGKVFYVVMLAIFAALALVGLWLGALGIAAAAVVLGAIFAYSAPFVLGGRWRTPVAPPASRRRPVRRR